MNLVPGGHRRPQGEDSVEFTSIRIIAADLAGTTAFYEAVTGTTAHRPAPVFAEVRAGGLVLALAAPETVAGLGAGAPVPGPNPGLVVEFSVPDIDAAFDRLQGAGVLGEVVLPPTTMPWGNRSTLFRDPEGNLVNLFSRPA